jgi:hypothetical protein
MDRSFCGLCISNMKDWTAGPVFFRSWSGPVSVFGQSQDWTSKHYWPHGANAGGSVGNIGIVARGLPMIFRTIQYLPGSSPIMGRVFSATDLYFLALMRGFASGAM